MEPGSQSEGDVDLDPAARDDLLVDLCHALLEDVRASPHNATLAPPLVLTAAEVTEIADVFEESVAEVDEQVVSGGGVEVDVAFGL